MFWCFIFMLLSLCGAGSSCPFCLPIYLAWGSSYQHATWSSSYSGPFPSFWLADTTVTDLTVTTVHSPLLSHMTCVSLGLLPLFLPHQAASQCNSDLLMCLRTPLFASMVPIYCLARVVVSWLLWPVGCHSSKAAAGELVGGNSILVTQPTTDWYIKRR